MSRHSYALVLLGVAFAVGCDEPVHVGGNPAVRAAVRAGARPDAGVDGGVDAGPAAIIYRDNDFVELGVINRDPFRDFVVAAIGDAPVINPRIVKMPDISLDQMRLIAVITGVPVPYAMIEDLGGVGHWIVRGDYIGRQDVVNAGGADGMPIALNWRVDRIRDGEVVVTRDDPLHPEQPPLMRSMTLRDRAADTASEQGVRQGALGNTGQPPPAAGDVVAPTPGALTAPRSPTPSATSTPAAPSPTPRQPAPPPSSTGSTSGTGSSPAPRPNIFGQGFSP